MKHYNMLDKTENKTDDGRRIIYFFGELKEIKETRMGHTFISCKDVKTFRKFGETETLLPVDNHENYNFIIPKRRKGIITAFNEDARIGNKYIFKLIEESLSKKMMVSEVFLA